MTPRQLRELRQRQADRGDAAGDRADIRDERQQAGRQADDQAEVEPGHGQRQRVVQRQDQAAQRLAAHPGGQDAVHLAGLRADHLGVAVRQPGIDHARSRRGQSRSR